MSRWRQLRRAMEHLGGAALFARDTLARVLTLRFTLRSVIHHCDRFGVQSLTVVNVCAVFIGMVLALQTTFELTRFGAKPYVGRIVSVSFVRELGPVFTGLMIAGRVGTGMAAELGAMRIGRQIDALRVMGTDPLGLLVAPRLCAAMLMMPVLTAIVLLFGIVAGLVIVQLLPSPVTYHQYIQNSLEALSLGDVGMSLFKAWVFGTLITLLSCYVGYFARGGTTGVGKAATRAMVASSIAVLISDFVITKVGLG